MSDALHKTTGDPATPGYRPLPGSGPTRGAELRTTVYAGLGIALGIFAGTFVADGTVERMLAGPQHQVAEVRPQAAAVAPSSSMAAVSTPQTIAAATTSAIVPAVEPARNEAPVAAADARPHEAQPAPPTTVARGKRAAAEIASGQQAPAPSHRTFSTLASSKMAEAISSAPHQVAVAHHRHAGRRAGSRLVRFSRRHGRRRRRPHPVERMMLAVRAPTSNDALSPVPAEEAADFTVEGNLTVQSVDSSRGLVQTYEGESFALGRPVNGPTVVSWLEYPADLHYRCDQSGNCTLAHGRGLVGSAKRTK